MAFNFKLLLLSRNVLEGYVIKQIEGRELVDHVELSTFTEDTKLKIDGKVYNKNGNIIPIQIKTRVKNYKNFSLPPKDIREEQPDRVFCFIDKTFDDKTVEELLSLNESAYDSLAAENPKVLMLTQKQFLKDKAKFEVKQSYGNSYYLIPKDYLENISYNK